MNKTLIIAEAGVNHNGDMETAKKLIDAAADAQVDLVKFQTFKADTIVSPQAKKATYQSANIGDEDDSQYRMLKKLELSDAQHQELIAYCGTKGIEFFSTAFDTEGLEYLNGLGFSRFKVPSGEITNYPYLKQLGSYKKPVILSTGMAEMSEIREAVELLCAEGVSKRDITVLHCNTEYPTPMEDVNLRAMHDIASTLDVAVGYSDHTLGIEVPTAAVALGAVVIEKHFTLDRNLPGPDHRASLEPAELKAMVKAIRNIEKAVSGDGKKKPSTSELKNKSVIRKSLHLKHDMHQGDSIEVQDLMVLRPGDGISPMDINTVIGKKLTKDLSAFTILQKEDLC
jgi:N-acetylneuraminate synthase/N,N'-diacetyllegionaminate synthase